MTSFYSEETTCPICTQKITVRLLRSTNNFGGQDTDFRSHAVGFDPLHIVVSICKNCGYSDYGHFFSHPRELSVDMKARIQEQIKPPLDEDPKTSTIYSAAAQIAEILGAPNEEIANLYLQAAWCCFDESDAPGEGAFRQLAAQRLESALANNQVEVERRPPLMYLAGELYRRIGKINEANRWFDEVLRLADLPENLSWLKPLAHQQRNDPKERIERQQKL